MGLGVTIFRSYRHGCEASLITFIATDLHYYRFGLIALIAAYHQHYVPASGHTKVRSKVKTDEESTQPSPLGWLSGALIL